MHSTEPKVFLIGGSQIYQEGLQEYFNHIGVSDWKSDAPSDVELLPEIYSRSCYMSYGTSLNKNLTKVREGNKKHLKHIIEVGHGSVLECSTLNFMFCDVSRILTHEIIRHRVGIHLSQQSLRYVRLDDLGVYLPNDPEVIFTKNGLITIAEVEEGKSLMIETIQFIENQIKKLNEVFKLDELPMEQKKKLTSFIRRIAPMGLSTQIGWSSNIRTLRSVLEQRTHPSAETEIRELFSKVGKIVTKRFPNLFSDYEVETVDGIEWYKTAHKKV